MKHEITFTFETDRPLTNDELTELLVLLELQINEPQVRSDDGFPTDAEFSTTLTSTKVLVDGKVWF